MGRKHKDITGLRSGKLVAIKLDGKIGIHAAWICKCDCGNEIRTKGTNIITRNNKSCGCIKTGEHYKLELKGVRSGKLVAIEPTGEKKQSAIVWKCKCDCGNTFEAIAAYIKSGRIKSCGCLDKGRTKEDLTGQIFGDYKILEDKTQNKKYPRYLCECVKCGNKQIKSGNIKYGLSTICRYCQPNPLLGASPGMIINNYKIIERIENTKNRNSRWLCECVLCGERKEMLLIDVKIKREYVRGRNCCKKNGIVPYTTPKKKRRS